MITDAQLADALIYRLNALLENSDVRRDISELIEKEVRCTPATSEHPTIQVRVNHDGNALTVIGLLNGLVGVLSSGPKEGWGYITVIFDDNNMLTGFERTDKIGLSLG